MRSYHIDKGSGLSGLAIKEHEMPVPGSREVLVRVRANSLNQRELMVMQGTYPWPVLPDVVPVSDGAGEVVSVGSDVTRVHIGERVMCAVLPYWTDGPFGWEYSKQLGGSMNGLLTEYAILPEEGMVTIPEHLSFAEAATLPCAAVTAWNALTWGRQISAGDTVLTMGSGGVSLFALQFSKLFGARVIATTSSDDKAQRLKALGADEVINYRTNPAWHEAVLELTRGQGVERVIEVGGADTLEQSIKATAVEGQISMVGWLANTSSTINIRALIGNFFTLRRIALGNRAHFLAMNRAISQHRLKPVIDRVFAFDDAIAAHKYYAEQPRFGKVVISQD
ncbi:zinc-dependent alcohol dehydrogenase family protein [Ktedonospora formicarum]|uniref:Alcohol dehydrogenase n=1 Tax=Ktedonospora formicarum TaxID=2778364 RepID=A0A8J3I331_9CHLR|nr:NAD(P)-dependent alcohol dehydrogenase [Ktedonospora formicarum]GHO48419.1 alcohol dehydrogenase [Ktedonospora formicarum]